MKVKKSKIIDVCGAIISFVVPSIAAIVEFPAVQNSAKTTDGGVSFLAVLHISSAAFAIIAVILALTLWRFFRDRIHIPKSGLALSAILFAISFGVEQFIHSFTVIMFWAVIGCAIGQVMFIIADRMEK